MQEKLLFVLLRLKVNIAAIQETRLASQGSIREKYFTFFWHGKSVNERRQHGVGFAAKNTLLQSVEGGFDGNERMTTFVYTPRKEQKPSLAYMHTRYMLMNK